MPQTRIMLTWPSVSFVVCKANVLKSGNVVTGVVLILSYIYMLLVFGPFHKSLVKTFGLWVGNLMIIFPINFLFLRGTMTWVKNSVADLSLK